MAILAIQSLVIAGLTPTYNQAIIGGDSFVNNGRVLLIVKNTSAGALGINVDTPAVDNFGFSGNELDVLLSIAAGAGNAGVAPRLVGPFSQARHNDTNGRVQLTYPDGITGLFIGLVYI